MTIAVVHFIADPALGAGAAVKSVALCRALAATGVRTRFITTDIGLTSGSPLALPGVEVVVVPTRFARFPVPLVTASVLRQRIADCDAVILVSHWTILNARVFQAARHLGVPYLVCPAGALRIQGRSRALKQAYQWVIGRRMITGASAVIATTALEATQLRESGVPASLIRVIPNGIDPNPSGLSAREFRSSRHLPDDPLLLFMGRMNPIKGPDLLIEAFVQIAARHPRVQLALAGRDEGLEPGLRAQIGRAGLSSRVHFLGHLDAAASVGAYRAASLLVVPSRHEAMSLVALEAAVVGTPVLLTEACGFDEIEAVGGGRVVPATAAALAAALTDLLSTPDALPQMGARLRDLVVDRYGWPSVVKQYLDVVGEVRQAGSSHDDGDRETHRIH